MSSTPPTLPLGEVLAAPSSDSLKSKKAETAAAGEAFRLNDTQLDSIDVVILPSPDDSESDEVGGSTSSETDTHSSTITSTTTNKTRAVCHGRVKNPESMVSNTWWKTVFSDQLYLQTDGDVVEDPAITLEEVRILEQIDAVRDILQPSTFANADADASTETINAVKVLDLCCGQGRHILQLAELYPSLELYGHDQSEFLIQLARTRAAASTSPNNINNKVHFTIGDCRLIPYPDNMFDLVLMMGNSFGYFSADKDNAFVLSQIFRVVRPGGIIILDVADGAFQRENFSPRGWEWVDDEMLVCRERWLSEDKKQLTCREIVVKTGEGVVRDQFYQERLYDSMEMLHLLEGAGLKRLNQAEGGQAVPAEKEVHDLEIKTGEMSQRGEDLGMMEQRNFVVAIKPAL
ncbi:hypothetical protein EC991_009894 [Linnemannia zychae]|nr:hypothetical protein EC991_009894 [Linnemannia zychae]